MKCGSLFTGIGGFDLAADWMDWETLFQCDINKFGQSVLKYFWKEAQLYEDITKTDFTKWRGTIDVLSGGFPCQPYSTAGRQLGTEDDRHLWPEMLRAIREIQPSWVVGENVRGLVSWNGGMVFDQVQSDLEDCGYEVVPFLLPACGVNALHQRYRIFFIAHHTNPRDESMCEWEDEFYGLVTAANSNCTSTVNTIQARREEFTGVSSTDPYAERLQRSTYNGEFNTIRKNGTEQSSRLFPPNWEQFPTQPPLCNGDDGISSESLRQRLRDDCHGVISEKEIDRIFSEANQKLRKESIKAGGNAVVPQLCLQIYKAIKQFETERNNTSISL